jgi:hypothetical protein
MVATVLKTTIVKMLFDRTTVDAGRMKLMQFFKHIFTHCKIFIWSDHRGREQNETDAVLLPRHFKQWVIVKICLSLFSLLQDGIRANF